MFALGGRHARVKFQHPTSNIQKNSKRNPSGASETYRYPGQAQQSECGLSSVFLVGIFPAKALNSPIHMKPIYLPLLLLCLTLSAPAQDTPRTNSPPRRDMASVVSPEIHPDK